MGAYTVLSASTKATHLQLIATVNSNLARIAAVLNNGIDGGSTSNNIKSATVQRVNMHAGASVGRFTGDIFSTNAHVRKGGTVTKSSGRVFNVAAGRWYVLDGTVTPYEIRQVLNTSAATDSVLANRKTYLDMGFDGVIDKNDVAHGANAPALAAGHLRFAYLSASASIVPSGIVMLGNSTYAAGTSWPKGYRQGIHVIAGSSTASAVRYLIIRAGGKARSDQDSQNIQLTSNIIIDRNASGAGGSKTAYTASTQYFLHLLGDTSGANNPTAILKTSASAETSITGYNSSALIDWRVTGASGHLVHADSYDGEITFRRKTVRDSASSLSYKSVPYATQLKIPAARVAAIQLGIHGTSPHVGFEFLPGGAVLASASCALQVASNAVFSTVAPFWIPTRGAGTFKVRTTSGTDTGKLWYSAIKFNPSPLT